MATNDRDSAYEDQTTFHQAEADGSSASAGRQTAPLVSPIHLNFDRIKPLHCKERLEEMFALADPNELTGLEEPQLRKLGETLLRFGAKNINAEELGRRAGAELVEYLAGKGRELREYLSHKYGFS